MINISHCSQNGAQYLKHADYWHGLALCSQAYRSRFASAQAYLYPFLLLSAENTAHIQVMLSHNLRQDDSDHHVHCFAAVSSRQSTLQDLEQFLEQECKRKKDSRASCFGPNFQCSSNYFEYYDIYCNCLSTLVYRDCVNQ